MIRRCLRAAVFLLLLPAASASWAQGERAVALRERQETSWPLLAIEGGMRRHGPWLWMQQGGIADFVSFNYVDGYLWGPTGTTLARILGPTYRRLELRPSVRYADARHAWCTHAALRYVGPPDAFAWVELYGGRGSTDFNPAPAVGEAWRGVASGIFGHNGFKLYDRTDFGLRASTALGRDFQLSGRMAVERRRPLTNHRQRNLLRIYGAPNIPRVRQWPEDEDEWWRPLDESWWLPDGRKQSLGLVDIQLDYWPRRTLYVADDVTVRAHSPKPVYSLAASSGWQGSTLRHLQLSARMAQTIAPYRDGRHEWHYLVAGGGFVVRRNVSLPDWHHFAASTFWWQRPEPLPTAAGPWDARMMGHLSHFRRLFDYELSTDRAWAEAHAEWTSRAMALSRFARNGTLREYLQLHVAAVLSKPLHYELTYGIDLSRQMRFALTYGIDRARPNGFAFTFLFIPM